ncbi:hypothetical protein [Micropruina glycogenica]|nr:hypothetical protein [Micropruina glycogenica]
MSTLEDDGYLVKRPSRRKLALTTVPGQDGRVRHALLEELFGSQTILDGVIHVVANGFDHIWPVTADAVAAGVTPFDRPTLIARNRAQEVRAFDDICSRIQGKHYMTPNAAPKWLLVIVNKVDLYWSEIEAARNRYYIHGDSDFSSIARELLQRVGTNRLQYRMLPVSTGAADYLFDSARGRINASSELNTAQAGASIEALMETLEELTNV